MPLEIAPKIYDVGVVDWAVRDFTDIRRNAVLHIIHI